MQEQAISKISNHAFQFRHDNLPMMLPCVLWAGASINVHGDLLECCCWGAEKSLKYGNINEFMKEDKSIKDYWRKRLLNLQENDICRVCNLRHPECKQRLAMLKNQLIKNGEC